MNLLKNRQITHSPWQLSIDDSPSRESGEDTGIENDHRIVPLAEWLAEVEGDLPEDRDPHRATSDSENALCGVLIEPGDEVSGLLAHLEDIPVIAMNAENFADGRIYSLAVELRQQFGYKGELRAIGVIPDNLQILERCGFDAFELNPEFDLEAAVLYFDELLPVYRYNQ